MTSRRLTPSRYSLMTRSSPCQRKGQTIRAARALVGLTVEARHGRKAALGEAQYIADRDILRLACKAVAALESARSLQNPVAR